jgi:hypothetical protein
VREIQRALSPYRGVRDAAEIPFCVIESALIETSVAQIAGADAAGCQDPNRSVAGRQETLAVAASFGRLC